MYSVNFIDFFNSIKKYSPSIKPLYSNAFEVLIFCIISLRTKDEVAYAAANRLFSLGNTPKTLASLNVDLIAQTIVPAGFYRVKAKQIHFIAKDLAEKNLILPPKNRQQLLAYPGVGIKTANLTLSRGFGIQAICVDVHVHRIVNRMRIVSTRSPEETEQELMKIVPRTYWIDINPVLVYWGQNYCGAKPKCILCPIVESCLYTSILLKKN